MSNQDGNETFQASEIEVFESFEEMGLKDDLLRGIFANGYDVPSEIQKRAIVPITKGGDVIAQAQSGTGKTATFAIGVLQLVDETKQEIQALVLSPTRELSQQTHSVVSLLGSCGKTKLHLCIGGANMTEDIAGLRSKPHVVIGTPGRINDVVRKGQLDTKAIKVLVIDEADEMLSQGFTEQVVTVLHAIPSSVQVVLLSATLPEELYKVTSEFMRSPTSILVKRDELTLAGIRQYKIDLDVEDDKFAVLKDIYGVISVTQAVIFCNSKRKVDTLTDLLRKEGFTVSSIHGEMQQAERDAIIGDFRESKSRILITTDLLARGIDVQQVSLVINYDIPFEKENYIHRIGRSGRFGRKGVAINFVAKRDIERLSDIEKYYSTEIEHLPEDMASIFSEDMTV
ncbi:MAG: ATP-dependent RNA helicase eIF4A [Amphiamblys sp. WSBS2006]|nr:MAG: ATP-dependent RNA helicase eIF4A [Amphiamblys sp. WSBS2006]